MSAEDLLEYHEGNDSWFYLGPLAAGISLARRHGPPINVDLRTDGRWIVESDMAQGVGETTEIAWRYFLGAELGPDDEGLDVAALRRELKEEA
jgi:hypothetical protein